MTTPTAPTTEAVAEPNDVSLENSATAQGDLLGECVMEQEEQQHQPSFMNALSSLSPDGKRDLADHSRLILQLTRGDGQEVDAFEESFMLDPVEPPPEDALEEGSFDERHSCDVDVETGEQHIDTVQEVMPDDDSQNMQDHEDNNNNSSHNSEQESVEDAVEPPMEDLPDIVAMPVTEETNTGT